MDSFHWTVRRVCVSFSLSRNRFPLRRQWHLMGAEVGRWCHRLLLMIGRRWVARRGDRENHQRLRPDEKIRRR